MKLMIRLSACYTTLGAAHAGASKMESDAFAGSTQG